AATRERARVERIDRMSRTQKSSDARGLPPTAARERAVGRAMPAALCIRADLAVANQQQARSREPAHKSIKPEPVATVEHINVFRRAREHTGAVAVADGARRSVDTEMSV